MQFAAKISVASNKSLKWSKRFYLSSNWRVRFRNSSLYRHQISNEIRLFDTASSVVTKASLLPFSKRVNTAISLSFRNTLLWGRCARLITLSLLFQIVFFFIHFFSLESVVSSTKWALKGAVGQRETKTRLELKSITIAKWTRQLHRLWGLDYQIESEQQELISQQQFSLN